LDAYSIKNVIRQGTLKKDPNKTPAANSQHFDLSHLDFYTTGTNGNLGGATDNETDTQRKKNRSLEKSKMI